MILSRNLIESKFIRRVNRFLVDLEVDGKAVAAHLPNSGRINELLISGAKTALVPRNSPHRKTGYDLVQILVDGIWVSTDARLSNRLVLEALRERRLSPFKGYDRFHNEPSYGSGRFDLLLTGKYGSCLVECKSVTLVENRIALFPDAPTTRGSRHVRDLAKYVKEGGKGAVIFVIQRSDANRFMPNVAADSDFAAACSEANIVGVEFYAYSCNTGFGYIQISEEIPVVIT